MIKKFVESKRSQNAGLILNISLLLLTLFTLGVQDFGIIGLILTGVIINQKLSLLFGGRAVSKLMDKYNQASLLVISYSGILFIHFSTLFFYLWLKPFDIQYLSDFFLISLMNALFSTNQVFIQAKKKENIHRILEIFQSLLQILLFVLFIFKTDIGIEQFLIASQISLFMAMTGSMGVLVNEIPLKTESTMLVLKEVIRESFKSCLNEVFQLLPIRISLFLIPKWLGYKVLGEFSIYIFLAENLNLILKNKGTVELAYSEGNKVFTKKVSIMRKTIYGKLLIILAGAVAMLILFLLLKIISLKSMLIMLALIPGILLFNMSKSTSYYFPDTIDEKQYFPAVLAGSIISGLISVFLIPVIGIFAASIATSVGYCTIFLAQYKVIRKNIKVSF